MENTRRKVAIEARRSEILRAALRVFARQGYGATVVEDIAREAGIGKGTLYLYFRSKEQIYMAALVEEARRLNRLVRERMDAKERWQDKIRAFFEAKLEFLASDIDSVRLYLAEVRSMMLRGVALTSEVYEAFREGESNLTQALAMGIARGEILPVDTELAALTICDLSRGLVERRLLGWCPQSAGDELDFTVQTICRALASPQMQQSGANC